MRPQCPICQERDCELFGGKQIGFRDRCWKCRRVRPNPERFHAQKRDVTKRKKQEIMTAYGGKCVCCGEKELCFLTIDHIHGGGGKHRKSLKMQGGVQFYRKLLREGCPKDYQILCFNCNMGRAINGGICPHCISKSLVS